MVLYRVDLGGRGIINKKDFNVEEGALLYTFPGGDADASNWRPGGGEGGVERGQGFVLYFFDDVTDPLESDGIDLDIPVGDADQTADVPVPWIDVNDEFEVLGNPFNQSIPFSNLKQAPENGGGSLADAGFQASAITWNGEEGRYDTILPGDDLPPYTGIVLQRATVGTGDGELVFTAPSETGPTATVDAGARTARHDTTNRVGQRLSMAATSDAGGRIQLSVQADGATQRTGSSAGATVWVGTDATEGWDAYDFGALPPPATDTYVQAGFPLERSAGSNDLVERVVASEPLGEAQAVDLNLPLSVRGVNMDGSAEIAWPADARAETPDDWTVELVDTQPGGGSDPVVHDLRTEGAYPFDLSEDGAVNAPEEARFRLRISAAPLPVELAGFEARRAREDAITVQWETLSETNNAGFEVQRRAAGSEHGPVHGAVETSHWGVSTTGDPAGPSWQTIARLEGAGTTDTPQSYQFEDADLPYAADSLSYRLRQVDTDGTASVTEPVTIARPVPSAELLPTYPNPARSQATIRYAVPKRQDVRIVLYDLLGRRVQTVVDAEAEGRTEQPIDVSRLASGTYFLRMQTKGHTETQRLTVVR